MGHPFMMTGSKRHNDAAPNADLTKSGLVFDLFEAREHRHVELQSSRTVESRYRKD
jgi:hypothetical protein